VNVRLIFMRVLVNAVVIGLTALLLPGIHVTDQGFGTYLILGVVFGLLNAFVKPIVEALTLGLLFVTYGLVLIFINTVMLWLLSVFLPRIITLDSLSWAVFGGILIGLLSTVLENILGMTPPILDDAPETTKGGGQNETELA
jgi:putative membrane protein